MLGGQDLWDEIIARCFFLRKGFRCLGSPVLGYVLYIHVLCSRVLRYRKIYIFIHDGRVNLCTTKYTNTRQTPAIPTGLRRQYTHRQLQ